MKEQDFWYNTICTILNKKGYSFEKMIEENHENTYYFNKQKKIGENRFRKFSLIIFVKHNVNWFDAEYKLRLQDFSLNEKGYIRNYWGHTPWVSAKSFFWSKRTDTENLIENIKFHYC